MLPPPPALLTTTTGTSTMRFSVRSLPIMRDAASSDEPAAEGTMISTGRSGRHACACETVATPSSASAAAAARSALALHPSMTPNRKSLDIRCSSSL
jgi:hypothetical protein